MRVRFGSLHHAMHGSMLTLRHPLEALATGLGASAKSKIGGAPAPHPLEASRCASQAGRVGPA